MAGGKGCIGGTHPSGASKEELEAFGTRAVQASLLEQSEGLDQMQDLYEVIEEMQAMEASEKEGTHAARVKMEQVKMKAAMLTENATARLMLDDGKLFDGLSVHDRARRKRRREALLEERDRKRVRWREYEMQQQQQRACEKRLREVTTEADEGLSKKAKPSHSDLCLNDDMDLVEPEFQGQQPMSIDQGHQEQDLCLEGSATEVFVASATRSWPIRVCVPSMRMQTTA
jgi:hypothetical protein